ncbi:winged helix-turn-helix domain-containing protein [Streptomyces sp. TRM66268-LWL]|uniref:Winged helix-turn-helix domain-containing protein n=1 Tax=Streptomyces polyasparticus TaxID=2767826 RepID=A0ABR7SA71_9ACTN|nr:BTAD domain-containing putative transcriptional regulator [Streptomyces polyasparticus]MBC9711899.1 winged helix-turn-helix domain-containing protein [Streptomyces polyasparticus]
MEFQVLGDVEARTGGGAVGLGTARQRRVLAALLMDVGRPVPVEQLVHRVWGESPPRRATDTLYTYVSRLRGLLPGTIDRGPGGYVLTADPATVDVHRFRELLVRARRSEDDARAVELFRQALGLWRGEPFAGADTPWFHTARELLGKELWAARLDCTDLRLRLGEHTALTAELADHSTEHPLDERLAAQYMLALHRCGRQADALAHYRRVRGLLADELGIDPGPELRRLHQSLLSGGTEPGPPAAAPPPDGDSWRVQCQLPLDIKGFAGRVDMIRYLEKDLTAPGAAPVVVSGSPGIGKSALAAHMGHRLRDAFPDGQWYVHLSGNGGRPRDPAEALTGLLLASGQEPSTVPEGVEGLSAALRSRLADRRVLLVLDDAADADQVRPLLPGTSGVAVLVTSRSDLRGLSVSHAARPVPLDVLTPGEARDLLANCLGPQRVSAEPAAAGRLAELCAHVPLALRIVAANLAARPGRPLAAYAAELAGGERLAKLAVTGDRQAAVRQAFDHSYAGLDPDAARLFALLGLHPGADFTTEAAAALLGSPVAAADELLDRLTTAGLLQHTALDRFRFHDLLRLYAAERAAADPGCAQAWQRLGDWYLATTDAATAFDYSGSVQLPRPRAASDRFDDRHQALAWLEAERSNLTAMVLRAAASGPHELAWQLTDQLRLYFYGRRHTADWEATTAAALHAAEEDGEVLAQALVWHSVGVLRQHTGDAEGARTALDRAQEGYRASGFTLGEVSLLTSLAIHQALRGDLRPALECQQKGYELLRALGRPVLLARALNTMGLIHAYLGEFEQAERCTTEAVELLRAVNRPTGTMGPLINRAVARHGLGRYAEALADAEEALRLHASHPHGSSGPAANEIAARIHRDSGRLAAARASAELSLRMAIDLGEPSVQADSLMTLGSIRARDGAPDVGLACLQEALELTHRSGLRHQEAEAHAQLAAVQLALGAASEARHHAEQARDLARARGLRPVERHARGTLARIAGGAG